MSECLTNAQNIGIGSIAATMQGVLLQPTLYWKNASAQGLPFTLNPALLYRGVGASIGNEVAQLCSQMWITGISKRLFAARAAQLRDEGAQISAAETIFAASMGGATTAMIATPIELVMIQQQLYGVSIRDVLAHIVRPGGPGTAVRLRPLFRGLLPTVARDSIYVSGMLGVTPLVTGWLMEPAMEVSSSTASITASIVGGCMGAMISHPFDMVKTCMQGDVHGERYGASVRSAFVSVYRERGLPGFWRGMVWRTMNIVACVFIVNECFLRLVPLLFPDARPAHAQLRREGCDEGAEEEGAEAGRQRRRHSEREHRSPPRIVMRTSFSGDIK